MTVPKEPADIPRQRRNDRLIRELEHDSYHFKHKNKGSAVCPNWGAVFVRGRRSWGVVPSEVHEQLCPACHRIKDRVAAEFLMLKGNFLVDNQDGVMKLIYKDEEREKAEPP